MLKAWLNPNFRIWLFMFVVNAAWMTLSWFFAERETWLWIIPIALSINFLLLTYDQVLKFRPFFNHPLVGSDAWGLLKIVHELSEELQVPAPKIFLIPRLSAQIFSYAKTRRQTRLFVTEGALHLLTPRQLRAALTFQMVAIRSSYNVLNYWVAAWLDLIFRVGKVFERLVGVVFGWSPPLAAWLISPWLWLLHAFLLGSRDFQKLDRETARLLDNPEDLAQALWKMDAYAHTRPWSEAWTFAHMCMVSPLGIERAFSFRRVQPTLKGRIKSLTGRYPL